MSQTAAAAKPAKPDGKAATDIAALATRIEPATKG